MVFINYLLYSSFLFATLIPKPIQPSSKVELNVAFDFLFENQAFQLNKKYKTSDGHELLFTKLQFYFSHFTLRGEEAKTQELKPTFNLIQLENGQHQSQLIFEKITPFDFNEVSFALGVDKQHNHQGAQNGALDPLLGMFWTWSQGYIFFRIEGYYYPKEGKRGGFIFHIGGDDAYRVVNLKNISPKKTSKNSWELPIAVSIDRLFGNFPDASITLDISQDNQTISVMGGSKAALIADNFAKTFTN